MKILLWPDPKLKIVSAKVEQPPNESFILELFETMKKAGGVGLSAVQVGIPQQVFVLNAGNGLEAFVNPEITKFQGELVDMMEGCLSTPGQFDKVKRWTEIEMKYQDPVTMEEKSVMMTGLRAHASEHECLPYSAKIWTVNSGLIPINKIVPGTEVYCMDEENKKITKSFVKNISKRPNRTKKSVKNKTIKKWVKLSFSKTGPNLQLECTDDHLCAYIPNVLSPNIEYAKAGDLLNQYIVRRVIERDSNAEDGLFNEDQISIVVGSILGDGMCSDKGELVMSHGEPQKEYAISKAKILNGLTKKGWSGFRGEFSNTVAVIPSSPEVKEFRKMCYTPQKDIPDEFLDKITPLALAVWYMDDGNLGHGRYPKIHAEGFKHQTVDKLSSYLNLRYGLESKPVKRVVRGKDMYYITISNRDVFFKMIAPFIFSDIMEYKVPTEYRTKDKYKININRRDFSAKRVTKIIDLWYRESCLFDLEIDRYHNFFANNTLVHNCEHLKGMLWTDHLPKAVRGRIMGEMMKLKRKGGK